MAEGENIMPDSFLNDWKKDLTEEGIKAVEGLVAAYNFGGVDAFMEAVISLISKERDDINRDEFMSELKRLQAEYLATRTK